MDSEKNYDWLGTGVYFWENDPIRAMDWAVTRGRNPPCVVGAVIDLGDCLDLTVQSGLRAVNTAYTSFAELQELRKQPLPENTDPDSIKSGDRLLRRLDRAVIEHLYVLRSEAQTPAFETVRALFPEGAELYPNAGFREKTHVQLCVRDHSKIVGVFRLPELQRLSLGLPDNLYG